MSTLDPEQKSIVDQASVTPSKLKVEKKPRRSRHFGTFHLKGKGTSTNARVNSQGYVDVDLHHDNNLTHVLSAALEQQERTIAATPKVPTDLDCFLNVPSLNIVIHIVGSRGDVQPFVALGKVLTKKPYGHRVRVCTHPAFKEFVEENGLEFFSIGGDPEQLMAYMVKNPGLMPGMDSLKAGDVGKRRHGVQESLELAWKSCIDPSPESQDPSRLGTGGHHGKTFIADAIIANPPSFAHIHCAEKLHIPLHMMFTMPWSPTQAFPHPLANIKATNVDKPVANFLSYSLMELMTWQGLGDIINNFRIKTLRLDPISALWAGGLIARLEVPYTYAWSTALIPKPKDWGNHITISGFYFLDLASNYKPPKELQDFLDAGEPPIYIGFGSIVIDEPTKTTQMIFDAVKKSGVRCLLSKGWSKLGGDSPPENIFLLDNCPHDWLFPRVKAVVHHGGAGTTAIGVALGKPTVVVPFFGDQPFWGAMIARAGAGPEPVGFHEMTVESLTESIKFALKPDTQERAKEMAHQIQHEDGKEEGAKLFHKFLPIKQMRCSLAAEKAAHWHLKHTNIRLSPFASRVLSAEGILTHKDLDTIHYKEWNLEEGPRGPLSGGVASIIGTLTDIFIGVGHLSSQIVKTSASELRHPHIHHVHRGPKEPEILTPVDEEYRPFGEHHHHHGHHLHMHTTRSRRSSKISTNDEDAEKLREDDERDVNEALNGTGQNINAPQNQPMVSDNGNHKSPGKKRWTRSHNHQAMHLYSRRHVSSAFPGLLYHKGGLNSSVIRERRKRAHVTRSRAEEEEHNKSLKADLKDIGFSAKMVTKALFTWPVDLTYNLASGFHNAPVLFCGDDTVRKHIKIVDFKSGCYAMGREVVLGFWDGTTGLVTQPYRGAKKEGGVGFLKGVGKGFGGLFFKTQAGIWAIPGYTLKGLEKQIANLHGSGTFGYIRTVRGLQGMREYSESTQEEKDAVLKAWRDLPAELNKGRYK